MKYNIIVDSASDLKNDYFKNESFGFKVIPLSIKINEKEFIDNDNINVDEMLQAMHDYKGKSTSSCPAPGLFEEACTADYNFIVTITKGLSGCYNSAYVAKEMVEENSEKKVYVFNTNLVSGVEILVVEKIAELINKNKEYDEIIEEVENYIKKRKLYFILQSFESFIKNGRVNKIIGLLANVLAIKPICTGENGVIKITTKIRGTKSCYKKLIELIGHNDSDFSDRTLIITHCKAIEDAIRIKELLEQEYNFKEIRIVPMRGLCSFYATEKGFILSY